MFGMERDSHVYNEVESLASRLGHVFATTAVASRTVADGPTTRLPKWTAHRVPTVVADGVIS